MKARFVCLLLLLLSILAQQSVVVSAQSSQSSPRQPSQESGQPSLTIYNQDFAVVREVIPLDLKAGENQALVNDITLHLEPDSVVLRDPSGKHSLQVLEQNYRADPVSQFSLLSLYEGRTINFETQPGQIVKGKVIRSGFVRPDAFNMNAYQAPQQEDAIIEVGGQLRFGLPGTPIFPDLTAETILKPRLEWLLSTDRAAKFPAEFSYVTGGFTWKADYNIVAPEKGDMVDIVGWVTMDNRSGKTFENARIKLMAGDVNKIQQGVPIIAGMARVVAQAEVINGAPAVTEKAFDEYHLYTLDRRTTLRDQETKQVEFIRAAAVATKQIFIYDGAKIDPSRYNGWNWESFRNDYTYGTDSNPKIWVMREFRNSEANHLGMPLPKGRVRFYRRGDDGQVEFTGENVIDHTPRDETVRVYTGNAFDVTGERRRVDYSVDNGKRTATESFEIKVRNHKKEAVSVRVVEHLYRGQNWEVVAKSDEYKKTDSNTIEFPVTVAADEEKTVSYTAHYTW